MLDEKGLRFCVRYGAKTTTLYRCNDHYLIEEFVPKGYRGNGLCKLKKCRMVNLSKITSINGKPIKCQHEKEY
jgi:hypothetical protein